MDFRWSLPGGCGAGMTGWSGNDSLSSYFPTGDHEGRPYRTIGCELSAISCELFISFVFYIFILIFDF